MKKILIATMLVSSLISQASFAEEYINGKPMTQILAEQRRSDATTNSGLSSIYSLSFISVPPLSASLVLSSLLNLSYSKTPVRVTKVEPKENNKTTVNGMAQNTPIEFDVETANANKANLKVNDDIKVKEGKLGYVMEANNVVLGVVAKDQNAKNFKRESLN